MRRPISSSTAAVSIFRVPCSAVLTHLEQAAAALHAARPFAVCPFCQGHGCNLCGLRGLLGKFRWDHVPRERQAAMARLVAQQEQAHASRLA